jgi:hypothetical protein
MSLREFLVVLTYLEVAKGVLAPLSLFPLHPRKPHDRETWMGQGVLIKPQQFGI